MLIDGDMVFAYAEFYLQATNQLASLETRKYRKGDWNMFCMPLLFNFRHYLELGLKACIFMKKEIIVLETLSQANVLKENIYKTENMMGEKIKCTHDLSKLLKDLEKYFPNRVNLFSENVKNLINLISDYDKKSDVFRYPFDTKGKYIIPEQPILQVDEIKKMIMIVSKELNSISFQLIEDLNVTRNKFWNKDKKRRHIKSH